jgi:hypothetical protein
MLHGMHSQLHVLREDGAETGYVDCYDLDYRKGFAFAGIGIVTNNYRLAALSKPAHIRFRI